MKSLLYLSGTILLLCIVGSNAAVPDHEVPDDDDHPPDHEDKIESGIVFLNKGSVLVTGEDWIVAKEFNITDVALLVDEAKSLFPSIKWSLENSTDNEGENIWNLQFFRDSINQEIEVIEPIIGKIVDKIRIFQNMLPPSNEDNADIHIRNKRGFWDFLNTIGSAIKRGFEYILFGNRNKKEVVNLNKKYNDILEIQKQQLRESKVKQMEIQFHGKSINEIEEKMKKVEDEIASLNVQQRIDMERANSRIDKTIEKVIILNDHIHKNSIKISELENDLSIMQIVHEKRINSINETLENVKEDVNEIKKTIAEHYTIIDDLGTKTKENRESIYTVKKELAYAISNWKNSQKHMIERLNMVVNITSTMRMMEIQLLSIDTYLTGLLQALDIIATGRLSPNLVSPIQLVEILRKVEDQLPSGVYPLTLIREEAVYEYYTYADVYAIAIPNAIRVFIKLPLKTPNRIFHLYEPYSLPFYHENATVFLEIAKPSDYVLVSADQQKVAEVPADIVRECKHKNRMFLCAPTFPIYEGKKCSLSLVKEEEEDIIKYCERSVVVPKFKSKWIRVEGGWVYSVPGISRLTRTRDGVAVESKTITGTGFLEDIPHTYTYTQDGTILFPNDKLGDNRTNAFREAQLFVPKVPNLLLLEESLKIGRSELNNIIDELSKSNSRDMEKVNLYSILKHAKEALIARPPEYSGSTVVPVLAVAVLVNYVLLGFMCWGSTKKNVIDSKKKDLELDVCA